MAESNPGEIASALNGELLQQGLKVLQSISAAEYGQPEHGASIGSHFRHVLDFYLCLEQGLANETIDDDDRERRADIEVDPARAAEVVTHLVGFLSSLNLREDLHLQVRMEASHPPRFAGSTLPRQLMFLSAHTIHHFAVIALTLKARSIAVPPGFGVAPSTLEYQMVSSY